MPVPGRRSTRLPLLAVVGAVAVVGITPTPVDAGRTSFSGVTRSVDVSWTEYDFDDVLGLPGNAHVGYLYAVNGVWGAYAYGWVTDFDCEPGELPGWGYHHDVVDESQDVVAEATMDSIDGQIDDGAARLDPAAIVDDIGVALADEGGDLAEEEYGPFCDFVQERYLDGTDTVTVAVDTKNKTATVQGTLVVHGGHGEHGEPGEVLGRPPVEISISGGERSTYSYQYEHRSSTFRYASKEETTAFSGGVVDGRIGAMGFADDADDVSWGGFSTTKHHSTEWVR